MISLNAFLIFKIDIGIVGIIEMMESVLTVRGYSVPKSRFNAAQTATLRKTLTVAPKTHPSFSDNSTPFPVYLESSSRFYLPRAWAEGKYGPADRDEMPTGDELRKDLVFQGSPREHQIHAIAAFQAAGNCGILCLPCGYGKTFTAIAIAAKLGKRFIVVVHKEFLVDQWSRELQSLMPGIRIGRIQGEKCDIGSQFDVAIAMIQTICSRTYPAGMFASFGLAIFDEAHHLGAEHFSQTLQRIQCKAMLGLTATPTRNDGLTKVFEWFLGAICFRIEQRDRDDSVRVEALRFVSDDPAYADAPTNWKGELIRARMLNQIAEFRPRTEAILDWVHGHLIAHPARKLLVLSDRREHLVMFEDGFKKRGHKSIGYYVGGMKQPDLDKSAECQILLGTYAMASEGFNVPTLNTILLATPKSNVEQSVGRVLRQRPEERAVAPLILDVVDSGFEEFNRQWYKRRNLYRSCGYIVRWAGQAYEELATATKEADTPSGTCLISDRDCCDSVCPECVGSLVD
jgi:superfamily II DNA or RNA helicase